MIDPAEFAQKQMELTEEFAKYILEHPEIDEMLPEEASIFFEVEGDTTFNEYGRELSVRREEEDGMTPVCVHVRGLEPPQGSRLIDGADRPDTGRCVSPALGC